MSISLSKRSRITLSAPVLSNNDVIVPAGTVGTVLAVVADGVAYDVEFAEPAGVATVMVSLIRSEPTQADTTIRSLER